MLHLFSALLLISDLAAIIFSIIRPSSKWLRWWPAILALVAILQLAVDGFYQTLIPVYIMTIVFIIIGFYKRNKSLKKSRFRFLKISWGIIWRMVALVLILGSTFFTLTFGKLDSFINALSSSNNADYSNLSWTESFKQMNSFLAQNYAFGEWKGIKWNALESKFEKQITEAERTGDTKAYYKTLREYVFSLPDGHVNLIGNDLGLKEAAIGGGYGFAVAQLSDGRVIAHIILPGGPAHQAGMAWGAEILTWNGEPIISALNQVSTLWYKSPIATKEELFFRKLNLLTRAPIGHQIRLTFRNPDEISSRQAILIAVDDNMVTYKKSLTMGISSNSLNFFSKPVNSYILPSGYGYLKINFEIPTFGGIDPVAMVRDAVEDFITADVPGVIIDVRSNKGGSDVMAPMMMAYFSTEPLLYEKVAFMKDGKQKVIGNIELKPALPYYQGKIAMLIDNQTISTGEGFPLIIRSLKRGPIIGFSGTNGSFGMSGSEIKLPGGYTVEYPDGASLNERGEIQCDSDSTLRGGIFPDVSVPLTEEIVKAIYVDRRDILLETGIQILRTK